MTVPLRSHCRQAFTVFALAAMALAASPFCNAKPMESAVQAGSRAVAKPKASPAKIRPAKGRYPDPRYRSPQNFSELQAVAGQVAKTSGRKIQWRLVLGKEPCTLVTIRGGLDDCMITIHPVAARTVPPNTWAFLFGHEFAHLVENLGTHSKTSPASELKADIAGARYAMAAGYRIDAFLGWVLTEKDQATDTHGTLRERVQAIAARFGIRQSLIQAEAQRYSKLREKR